MWLDLLAKHDKLFSKWNSSIWTTCGFLPSCQRSPYPIKRQTLKMIFLPNVGICFLVPWRVSWGASTRMILHSGEIIATSLVTMVVKSNGNLYKIKEIQVGEIWFHSARLNDQSFSSQRFDIGFARILRWVDLIVIHKFKGMWPTYWKGQGGNHQFGPGAVNGCFVFFSNGWNTGMKVADS